MVSKHAYMIIAHNEFEILRKLIVLLDDIRNDIYIHIDKKVKEFDFESFQSIPTKATLYFVPRISVNWGGYSQIACELILLKEAVKRKKYDYYHLLSGVDLPLKTQDEIHRFFELNKGTEFVHFSNADIKRLYYRIRPFHFLQEYERVSKIRYINLSVKAVNACLLGVQKLVGINRLKSAGFSLKFGSQWFSITHELATYVVQNEKWINKYFSFSSCSDELFLQTLTYNSRFKDKLTSNFLNGSHLNCMRNIDWYRGNPYVWKSNDFEELMASEFLFARKFSTKVDETIINKIFETLEKKQSVYDIAYNKAVR